MAFKRSAVRSRLSPPRQTTKPWLCGLVLPKRKMRIRIPGQKVTEVFRRKHLCDFLTVSIILLVLTHLRIRVSQYWQPLGSKWPNPATVCGGFSFPCSPAAGPPILPVHMRISTFRFNGVQ